MPVGVSIASFVADGVSLLATEKTLTDHGLSLVADQDCAMWRGLKGEDICLDTDDPYGGVLVAEGSDDSPVSIEQDEAVAETVPDLEAFSANPASAMSSEDETNIAAEPTVPDVLDEFVTAAGVTSEPEVIEEQPSALKEAQPIPTRGGTYYVIASYYRAADAERFAKNQPKLGTQILSGTAKGKSVYRVAIGPVTDPASTKRRLVKSGYHDTWALKQENPEVIVEIASLD